MGSNIKKEAMERAGDLKHSAHYYDTDRNQPLPGAALTAECAVLAEKVGAAGDRNAVLEEAAQLCDRFAVREMHPAECAGAIRAMKSAPVPDPCPQCHRGGVCETITCGRLRSSELMALYGTPAAPVAQPSAQTTVPQPLTNCPCANIGECDGSCQFPKETVLVPKWAGQFNNFQEWVNKAKSRLASPDHCRAIAVDTLGRRCALGADMKRASDEGTFPVRYFWECELTTASQEPSAQVRDAGADILRDMLLIQDACNLHTDEYAPGSVIEYIKELEADLAAAQLPAQGTVTEALRARMHPEPVGHVRDHFKGTEKAYRSVVWADRTFAMDVPDGAPLYALAAPAQQPTDSAARPVYNDFCAMEAHDRVPMTGQRLREAADESFENWHNTDPHNIRSYKRGYVAGFENGHKACASKYVVMPTQDELNGLCRTDSAAQSGDSGCRMTGGICACRSGGSFGGCAKERADCCTNEHSRLAAQSGDEGVA